MRKNILLITVASAMLTLASCDMDKEPYDSIPDTEALQTPTDFENMSVPLYTGLRSCVGSSTFYNGPDFQSDDFNATFGSGVSDLHSWSFSTSLREGDAMYSNCQTMINRANFIIDGYKTCDMSNENLFTPGAIENVENVVGEAYFIRAYFLFYLAQYFCQTYDEATADEPNSGVSYRTDYYPSSSAATYPARNTLRQTYTQITQDLEDASHFIKEQGEQSSYSITADAVKALQARVALTQKDYRTAATKATELINDNTYGLANSSTLMQTLWWDDYDTESIFKLYGTQTGEYPAQTGRWYLPYTTGGTPTYIPTQTAVDLYSANDYRRGAFFTTLTLQTSTGITGQVYALCKYPDHGYVWQTVGQNDYARFCIEPKVFRISEMYLIAAEAYAMMPDGLSNGAYWLNELERNRISGYRTQNFSSQATLLAEIKNERHREFIGEGMRFLDLKRWNEGIRRGTPQNEDLLQMPGSTLTTSLSKAATDIHFVWPIPQNEIDTNPQIVQNPGY